MFQVWNSVKAVAPHPRAATDTEGAQAGTVVSTSHAHPDEVAVKWDKDGEVEAVAIVQLQAL
jgi:hypothetical protein